MNVPSLLSDALLFENFGSNDGLWPFRYRYAPDRPSTLRKRVRERFFAFSGVPRMFHSRLEHLEEQTGAPFLDRWRHEWEWLQAANECAEGDPSFFFQGDQNLTGQFDFADREIYVSAFLRTLAFAASNWGLSKEHAVFFARAAITLNRGLADVACIKRPEWTDDVILDERTPTEAARIVWDRAHQGIEADESLGALRVVERTEKAFVKYRFRRALGLKAGFDPEIEPRERGWLLLPTAHYAGALKPPRPKGWDQPIELCGASMPLDVGRLLVDIIPHVQLPAPLSPGVQGDVSTMPDSIVLSVSGQVFGRWQHWFSDWDPTAPKAMDSLIGYRTVVKDTVLRECPSAKGLATGVWCEVAWGTREYSYSDFTAGKEGFWLSGPDNLRGC